MNKKQARRIKYFKSDSCICKAKRTFISAMIAKWHCIYIKRVNVEIYKCLFCKHYHIGKHGKNTNKTLKRIKKILAIG